MGLPGGRVLQAKPGSVPPLQLPGAKGKWTGWGGGKRRDKHLPQRSAGPDSAFFHRETVPRSSADNCRGRILPCSHFSLKIPRADRS